MNTAGVSVKDRKVVPAALKRAEETGYTAVAMELDDGTIITEQDRGSCLEHAQLAHQSTEASGRASEKTCF